MVDVTELDFVYLAMGFAILANIGLLGRQTASGDLAMLWEWMAVLGMFGFAMAMYNAVRMEYTRWRAA